MSSNYESLYLFLNVVKYPDEFDELFGCNFVLSINGTNKNNLYKYNVSHIVKINDNAFDVYVVPVENEEYEDFSTGCLRFFNIGTYAADGNVDDQRLCFDMILLQNNNDVSNDYLSKLYNVKLYFILSGQVAY